MQKQVLTTGEAAKIANLSQQTIIRLVDTGKLPAYKIPGSRFRRIERKELLIFLKAEGVPINELESADSDGILVHTRDPQLTEILAETIPGTLSVVVSKDVFESGLLYAERQPQCVVIDMEVGNEEVSRICNGMLPKHGEQDCRPVVILLHWRGTTVDVASFGAESALEKPIEMAALLRHVDGLLAERKKSAAA